ncbi:MAG: hypothetical protein VKJ46_13100 [Leptolyngbyaceae bacterium]|nr:hypothetical protein [Leptolyngbyaceae bacterium]
MLHLAQVVKKGALSNADLRLLAYQKAEEIWAVVLEEDALLSTTLPCPGEGALVLVELADTREILQVQESTHWVLALIQAYLTTGITPEFLQKEAERAEQWRQSLTLQSQELSRRALEIEARREQIEALEEKIKQEKQELELMAVQLKTTVQKDS